MVFMDTSDLFEKIRNNLEKYQDIMKAKHVDLEPDFSDVHKTMSIYNYENFREIMASSGDDYHGKVDSKDVKEMEERIDHYFQLHGSGCDEFKEFIKAISLYLTFIAIKPLHPQGIFFSNNTTVFEENGTYYCTGKKIFIKDELSLCKYCVCQGSDKKFPP
jgi:uncharacterized protein (UPF0305 family)